MALAFETCSLSDDPKARLIPQSAVGAVIAEKSELIARSANIVPPPVLEGMKSHAREITESDRYFIIEHAERAAIFHALKAGHDLSKATIYCTRFPCSDCARAIIWAGIRRAVFASGYGSETRWLTAQRAARQLFKDAGIRVRFLPQSVDG
ncbi:deoxycytidylate deaminase [Sphingopyxis fribergensis]